MHIVQMHTHPPASLLSVCPSSSPSTPRFSMERGCVYPEYVHTQQSILQSLMKLGVCLHYHAAPCRDSHFILKSVLFSYCNTALKFENLSLQDIALVVG